MKNIRSEIAGLVGEGEREQNEGHCPRCNGERFFNKENKR